MSRRTPISLAKARNDALLLRKIADDIEVADEIARVSRPVRRQYAPL